MTQKTEYQKPDPAKATFKMLVYFKNGSARTYYNYHTAYSAEKKRVYIDDSVGLRKLERLLLFKFKEKYVTAIILHKDSDRQVKKYVADKKIAESSYTFYYDAAADAVRFKFTN